MSSPLFFCLNKSEFMKKDINCLFCLFNHNFCSILPTTNNTMNEKNTFFSQTSLHGRNEKMFCLLEKMDHTMYELSMVVSIHHPSCKDVMTVNEIVKGNYSCEQHQVPIR